MKFIVSLIFECKSKLQISKRSVKLFDCHDLMDALDKEEQARIMAVAVRGSQPTLSRCLSVRSYRYADSHVLSLLNY